MSKIFNFKNHCCKIECADSEQLYALLDPVLLNNPPDTDSVGIVAKETIPLLADDYVIAGMGSGADSDYISTMPWVVRLDPERGISALLDENKLLACGVFLQSESDVSTVCRLLESLVHVNGHTGESLWLRLYDPRIFPTAAKALPLAGILESNGVSKAYSWNMHYGHMCVLDLQKARDNVALPLILTESQTTCFHKAYAERFFLELTCAVAEAKHVEPLEANLYQQVLKTAEDARNAGYDEEESIAAYVRLAALIGWEVKDSNMEADTGPPQWLRLENLAAAHGVPADVLW